MTKSRKQEHEDQCALLRGLAMENHALFEARAEAICSMGVGCGVYGVCYAEAHGEPDMCPIPGTFSRRKDEDEDEKSRVFPQG
jgi:hypothetical protein